MPIEIPNTMQAALLAEAHGPLHYRTLPTPTPGPGEVVVKMAAAPINPSDLSVLRGSYGSERSLPIVPGNEGSGTVVQTGPGWMGRALLGRRVACAPSGGDGTWAEYMLTRASRCVPLFGNISDEQGAMLIVNPMTAAAFFDIARERGHAALVSTAAASALGRMIARLGVTQQIPIIHIVHRAAQVKLLKEEGAEHILDSSQPGFEAALQALAHQLHATLWLDAIAGDMTQTLLAAAPFGSTLLLYAHLSGHHSAFDARVLYLDDKRMEGFYLPNWIAKKSLLQTLFFARRVQARLPHELRSHVVRRFPLAEAQAAVDHYIHHMTEGKVLLVMGQEEVKRET
jgi:NADPH:quinone reductase-like Zn-dependent oxidoreductase